MLYSAEFHSEIEEQLRQLLDRNDITLEGKKVIDIGGHDGNITIPLANLAYKMGAIEVHVVDPRLDISDYNLERHRITGHRMRVEDMTDELKGTFDFATIFAYQNITSYGNSYPQGIADILQLQGKLLFAGRFGTSKSDELKPYFAQFLPANLKDRTEGFLSDTNPRVYLLSSPVHSKEQGLRSLSEQQRRQSPEI